MSTSEYISIPIDSELKTESDCILADIGLSTPVVVFYVASYHSS